MEKDFNNVYYGIITHIVCHLTRLTFHSCHISSGSSHFSHIFSLLCSPSQCSTLHQQGITFLLLIMWTSLFHGSLTYLGQSLSSVILSTFSTCFLCCSLLPASLYALDSLIFSLNFEHEESLLSYLIHSSLFVAVILLFSFR